MKRLDQGTRAEVGRDERRPDRKTPRPWPPDDGDLWRVNPTVTRSGSRCLPSLPAQPKWPMSDALLAAAAVGIPGLGDSALVAAAMLASQGRLSLGLILVLPI